MSHPLGDLEPGVHYSSVTFQSLAEVAVDDPPRGRGGPLILGADDQDLWPASDVVESANGGSTA